LAEHPPTGPLETSAGMDYPEHQRTYDRFLVITKYGALVVVALLVAMAFGFFSAGFFSAVILFVLIVAVGSFALR
jgi:hypothetical protein